MAARLRAALGAAKERLLLRARGVPFPPVAPAAGVSSAFIGSSNSAGQGWAWARALETAMPEAHVTSARLEPEAEPSGFRFPVDQRIFAHYAAHSPAWQRRQFEALRGYRGVLIESGDAVLARMHGGDAAAQAEALAAHGVRIGLVFHGSDIRDPDAHLAREPESHFAQDPALTQQLRELTARNRALAGRLGASVFVSTPDLLREIDGAQWLPVVVDVERWATTEAPCSEAGPLRVAHVPSSSHVKGTDLILPTLEGLAEEGVITYTSIQGRPHEEMPAAYRGVDVVLDQFRAGIYGVAACEALAAGRIVVSHVADEVRERTATLTGEELPIVQATSHTLGAVLRDIATAPHAYRELAARGPGFVRRHHDGTRSGAVLAQWLQG